MPLPTTRNKALLEEADRVEALEQEGLSFQELLSFLAELLSDQASLPLSELSWEGLSDEIIKELFR